jgi:DNA-binding HxlR family transcriptional regulator
MDNKVIYEIKGKKFHCPIELSMSVFAGRWKPTIICELLEGTKRYGELKRNITGINHKMLAEQLKELEAAGVISRHAYPVVPPKVEYQLTEIGEQLRFIIQQLQQWGTNFQTNSNDEVVR